MLPVITSDIHEPRVDLAVHYFGRITVHVSNCEYAIPASVVLKGDDSMPTMLAYYDESRCVEAFSFVAFDVDFDRSLTEEPDVIEVMGMSSDLVPGLSHRLRRDIEIPDESFAAIEFRFVTHLSSWEEYRAGNRE